MQILKLIIKADNLWFYLRMPYTVSTIITSTVKVLTSVSFFAFYFRQKLMDLDPIKFWRRMGSGSESSNQSLTLEARTF